MTVGDVLLTAAMVAIATVIAGVRALSGSKRPALGDVRRRRALEAELQGLVGPEAAEVLLDAERARMGQRASRIALLEGAIAHVHDLQRNRQRWARRNLPLPTNPDFFTTTRDDL